MKILIVGGTGLISTAITRQLLARGDHVTVFNRGKTESRLSDGTPSMPGMPSPSGHPDVPGPLTHLIGDRTVHPAFEEQVQRAGRFDCVIDMVCFRSEDAASVVRAFRGRTGRVVFCSTTSVYPMPPSRYPVPESEPPGATGRYGSDKAACEALLLAAHQRGDLQVAILRPAHVYGEGQGMLDPLSAGTAYIDRLRQGLPVVVHGDGTSLWSACYADDVAGAFVGATDSAAATGRCYNVAADEWLTWNRYTELVAEAAGASPPRIIHIPTDLLARVAPDIGRRCVESYQFSKVFDTTAAHHDLGFSQRVPFVEGVRRTIAWLDGRGMIKSNDTIPWYDRLVDAWERAGAGMARELTGG